MIKKLNIRHLLYALLVITSMKTTNASWLSKKLGISKRDINRVEELLKYRKKVLESDLPAYIAASEVAKIEDAIRGIQERNADAELQLAQQNYNKSLLRITQQEAGLNRARYWLGDNNPITEGKARAVGNALRQAEAARDDLQAAQLEEARMRAIKEYQDVITKEIEEEAFLQPLITTKPSPTEPSPDPSKKKTIISSPNESPLEDFWKKAAEIQKEENEKNKTIHEQKTKAVREKIAQSTPISRAVANFANESWLQNLMFNLLPREITRSIATGQGLSAGITDWQKNIPSKVNDWKDSVAHRYDVYKNQLGKFVESGTETFQSWVQSLSKKPALVSSPTFPNIAGAERQEIGVAVEDE